MDPANVASIRRWMAKKSTEELVAAYSGRSGWNSEETLEAVRQILVERRIQDSSIDLKPKEGDEHFAQRVEEILAQGPLSVWGRRWPRLVLWLLHLGILAAAFSLTPSGYAFQLGASAGAIVIFGTLFLWVLLFLAKEAKPIIAFCVLALVHAGVIAAVGMHYRASDTVLQQIMSETRDLHSTWAAEMSQFRIDPLFEYLYGDRPLDIGELVQLQERANAGKAKALELQSENEQWLAEAERRVAGVSPREARNFRRGVETMRSKTRGSMKTLQDYFSEIGQLIGFLLEIEGQYRVTREGPVFDKDEDMDRFARQMDEIVHLEEQLESAAQAAEEILQDVPVTH